MWCIPKPDDPRLSIRDAYWYQVTPISKSIPEWPNIIETRERDQRDDHVNHALLVFVVLLKVLISAQTYSSRVGHGHAAVLVPLTLINQNNPWRPSHHHHNPIQKNSPLLDLWVLIIEVVPCPILLVMMTSPFWCHVALSIAIPASQKHVDTIRTISIDNLLTFSSCSCNSCSSFNTALHQKHTPFPLLLLRMTVPDCLHVPAPPFK